MANITPVHCAGKGKRVGPGVEHVDAVISVEYDSVYVSCPVLVGKMCEFDEGTKARHEECFRLNMVLGGRLPGTSLPGLD